MEHFAASTLIRELDQERAEGDDSSPEPDPEAPELHPQAPERRPRRRKVFSEGRIVFVICFAAYITVGFLLDFHYGSFNGDAVARMANAFYILYSRDRHMAAVGFVWNPGTSIADFVPLLFYKLWTPLASHMFAASLVSASCMAGAVYQLRCTLAEWGVARMPRLVLVAIFALNAMIIYYGGDGMSEGLYLFTLIATSRYLLRWLRHDDLHSLVYAASALGLCYLARNEAVAPAVFAGALVFGVSYVRSSAVGFRRAWSGMADLVIFEIPFFFAFIGWAIVSYVITGSPFQQFTSVYGTASQLAVSGNVPVTLKGRILQDVHDVFYLAPAIPLIVIVALVLAWRRRDIGILAPITVVGGGLAFSLAAYVDNKIDHWFRYFITAVPLEVILVGSFFATVPALVRLRTTTPAARPKGAWLGASIAVLMSLLLLLPSSITTIMGMANPKVGFEEREHLGYIFSNHPTSSEASSSKSFPDVLKIANYFASKHLPNGQVIVDNFSGCIPNVILASPNPAVWVIPNDRSFQRTLADPLVFHAHYILDVDPIGNGRLTAPNISYPNLWSNGGGFAKVIHTFPAAGECPELRLFKVFGHPRLGV